MSRTDQWTRKTWSNIKNANSDETAGGFEFTDADIHAWIDSGELVTV